MTETMEIFSTYVLPVLYGLGSVLLISVASRAKKMLKTLTLDDVTNFAVKFIEKLTNKPTVLAGFIKTIAGLDVTKKAFDNGKVYVVSQIHSLESQIMSLQDKLDMGIYEDSAKRAEAVKLLAALRQDKAELEKLNAQTNA